MRSIFLCTLIFAAGAAMVRAQDTASVSAADGFQCPVGPNGTGEGYYIARGYRANGHLGDDWNGIKGGDTDMGDPVYSTAHGLVVFAKNYHVGWGNVVIIRHAYHEGFSLRYVDSLYGHLANFNVREGQQVKRGQLIGHIGNNNGMYDAHLHFEIRKNLNIGMYRSSFPRDGTNYYEPNQFIAAHLSCSQGGRTVSVPINTFPATAPPSYIASKVHTPMYSPGTAPASHRPPEGAGSLRLSRDSEKAAPGPKVVTAPSPTPKPTVPPAPVVETPTTASSTRKSLPPSTSRSSTAPAVSKKESTPTPAPKSSKTASTKVPSETPSLKKEETPSPKKESATESTKEPTTASTKKGATPAPSGKSGPTASTKSSSTPAPKAPGAGTTKSTTTAAKKAAATPARSTTTASDKKPAEASGRETATAKVAPPEPAPSKTAKAEPKPSILDANNHEPPPPPPSTEGGAIRRSAPAFRVDRFQDLRGMGY